MRETSARVGPGAPATTDAIITMQVLRRISIMMLPGG
jgi:hypothetical protein